MDGKYLLIAMDHVPGMEILGGSQELVDYVLLVHLFEDVAPLDHVVQVRVWMNSKLRRYFIHQDIRPWGGLS